MTIKEKIDQLRADLHRHNYNYYVLNAPEISDKEFDDRMRELQELEKEHPEYQDENSPTMRVGTQPPHLFHNTHSSAGAPLAILSEYPRHPLA